MRIFPAFESVDSVEQSGAFEGEGETVEEKMEALLGGPERGSSVDGTIEEELDTGT